MESSQKPEFDAQFAILCGGYNIPPTPARQTAFFLGLGKMTVAQFTRVVAYAVSEEGPDEFPTPKGIWKLHREVLRAARAPAAKAPDAHEPDHLEFLANRLLLDVWWDRLGFGSTGTFKSAYGMVECKASTLLTKLLAAKRALVNWYLGPIREGDILATPNAFMQDFEKTIGQIIEISAKVRDRWQTTYSSEDALKPFPAHMGRQSTYIDGFLPKNPANANTQENLL